jgi:hypothetical protein
MVDIFKQYFIVVTFEQIPMENNRVVNVMETIGSLLDIPQNILKYEFLVEQLFILAFKILETKIVYVVVGLNFP